MMKKQLTIASVVIGIITSLTAIDARAALDPHYSVATGGTGQQIVYLPTNTFSGTMTASVPLFNPALGTLIQADYEFAGNTNGSWQALSGTGTIDINLTGPADVGGQPMGSLVSGFSNQSIVDTMQSPYGTWGFANATFTSGAFFNTLTGIGNITLSWQYTGTTAISTPAVGQFDWGGSVHALYTYVPIPEPTSFGLLGIGGIILIGRKRKN